MPKPFDEVPAGGRLRQDFFEVRLDFLAAASASHAISLVASNNLD
jgi:hypothetical protein